MNAQPKPLRALLVDDEQPARQRMRQLLSEFREDVAIVAEAGSGADALALIEQLQPEVVFLDIMMPGMTGLEVVNKLDRLPYLVFITAMEQYAVHAFEKNAIDYLLKPVTTERLAQTLAKLRHWSSLGVNPQYQADDIELVQKEANTTAGQLQTLPVKIGDRILLIRTETVAYFQAQDKYVNLMLLDGKKYLLEQSITYLEQRIGGDFLRISRSLLVNMAHVKEVVKLLGSRYALTINDKMGSRLESGSQYAASIKKRLQF